MSTTMCPCIFCEKPVKSHQQAIDCDSCGRWQHRGCGNTGVTKYMYGRLKSGKITVQFVCERCNVVSLQNDYSAIEPDHSTRLMMPPRPSGPLESSHISFANSEVFDRDEDIELTMEHDVTTNAADVTTNAADVTNEMDTSLAANETTFDVPRPHRSVETEVGETSLADETINRGDIGDIEAVTTFEVVETGSIRGKRKLVSSSGYAYVVKRQLRNGTTEWRCSVRGHKKGCPAVVRQAGENFSQSHHTHSHAAQPGISSAVKVISEVKTSGKQNLFETANNLVRDATEKHPTVEQPACARVSEQKLIRVLNRARATTRPKDPEDLTFQLDDDFLQSTIDEPFLRKDVVFGSSRHLIFATSKQLELLSNAKTWYIDATFKVISKPFYQLLSVHGFVKSGEDVKQLPLCFVMMSDKRKKSYKKVFKAIKEMTPDRKVDTFVVDFEAGLWQGLRSAFEDPHIQGCAFHFGQALWRKVQENGLQPAYQARDNVYKALRKIFALPLLPADDIREAFDNIRSKIDPDADSVISFVDYVGATWMDNAMWPVESWSVYGRSVRTNNDVEGWHARMNRRAKKGNLAFYLLISLLFQEASIIPTQVKLIKEGK